MSPALLLIVVFIGVMYILVMRPQRRRRMDHDDMVGNLDVGDEVVTAGGLYGVIRQVRGEDLVLEVSPGVEVRVAKRAVAGIVEQPGEEDEDEDEEEGAAETENADEEEPEEPLRP